jgi:Ca2+-binding EF-hand superfamily protein
MLMMAEELTPEYVATLRRMTRAQKLRTAFGLYGSARKVKAARLRQMHPDWTEEQVQEEVKRIFMHAVT